MNEQFSILSTALLLMFVLDPFGNIPVLLSLLKDMDDRKRYRIILREEPLPRACWNQSELDRLEQLSWQVERNLFRDATGGEAPGEDATSEALHHVEFVKVVQKRQAYCWVDTNRTVQEDPQWRAFFEAPYDPTRGRPDAANASDTAPR